MVDSVEGPPTPLDFEQIRSDGLDGEHELSSGTAEFVIHADRLARDLRGVTVRLNMLREALDRDGADPDRVRATTAAVGETVQNLDRLLREAGLTMLMVVSAWYGAD
ncbi:hypothetical protein [Nocardia alni]|uniref:hypothetical protein n=1 Tax=Nocardia alni TaxID=2815723 RepID=UPI001C212422|nr:hypothetical protein [Nocardia alni]